MKRSLAIEELGTSFQVEKRVPLVRLKGHWLKAAGFTAGKRVTVICLSPGVMELRAETVSATLKLILGGAPEGKPDLPRAVPEGSCAGVRALAEAPTRLDLPPDLTVPAGSRLAAWAVPNATRWGHSHGFPLGTGRVAACAPSWEASVPPQSTPNPSRPSPDFAAKPRINEDSA